MEGTNRRSVLKGLLVAGAVGAGGAYLLRDKSAPKRDRIVDKRGRDTLTEEDRKIPYESLEDSFLNVPYSPREYTLGRIADRRVRRKVKDDYERHPVDFKGLLTMYTGIRGPVPKVAKIDFRYQLAQLWKAKLKLMGGKEGRYPAGTTEHVKNLFNSYNVDASNPIDIENYRRAIDASMRGTRAGLNLNSIKRLEAFRSLTDTQVKLIKEFE